MIVYKLEAPWCISCKKFDPIFNKLKEEYKDIHFETINVENDADMASMLWITSIPAIVIYDWVSYTIEIIKSFDYGYYVNFLNSKINKN